MTTGRLLLLTRRRSPCQPVRWSLAPAAIFRRVAPKCCAQHTGGKGRRGGGTTDCLPPRPAVVVLLNDIRDVNVEEEKVRYFGKGYVVVLRFATGFSHPLTQSAVMGHRR